MTTLTFVTPEWMATVNDFQTYWFMDLGKDHESAVQSLLSRTWTRIQAALVSSGQAECALGVGMQEYLNEMHVIIAMVMCNIPGVRLEVAQREMYNNMFEAQLASILSGETRVCAGVTNSNIPSSSRIEYYAS